MTKMHLLARFVLTVLGIFVIVALLDSINVLAKTHFGSPSSGVTAPKLVLLGVLSCVGCMLTYYFLFNSDSLVAKMVGPISEERLAVELIWIIAGFRLVFFLCGLLIMRDSIWFLIRAGVFLITSPKVLVDMIVYKYVDEIFRLDFYEWLQLFVKACKAALGIYLILGAPHFVHRQIRKLESYPPSRNVENQTQ